MTAGGHPAASPHAQHDDLWDRAGSEAAAEVSSVLDTAQGLGIRWKGLDLGRQTHSPHTEGHGRNIRQGSASTLPLVGSSERQTHTGKCISLGGNVATPSLGE